MDFVTSNLLFDFINDKKNYHKKKTSIKSELISRAMGAGKNGLRVLDLSAGMGIDAIFLSQLGYKVVALERNKSIFNSLHQAWKHLNDEQRQKVSFINSDAIDFLNTSDEPFDIIYFDPMFPEKKKSALPKKEMVLFRQLVGDDLDADQVLKEALNHKTAKRVVVKRPVKAKPLLKKPNHQLLGKLVRFDIYGVNHAK